MGVEIEHKFLVKGGGWRADADRGTPMRQGYLSLDPERTVRVRLAGQRGTLTIKGRSRGAARAEFEWPIPADEARELLDTLAIPPLVEKVRYRVPVGGHVFEVDVFSGRNAGLVVAEVELAAEGDSFERPGWLGPEVTGDGRYANAALVSSPYDTWSRSGARDATLRGHDD